MHQEKKQEGPGQANKLRKKHYKEEEHLGKIGGSLASQWGEVCCE